MKIVAESSAILCGAGTDAEFDEAMNRTSQAMGELFAVDGSYLFLFSPDLEWMTNTHEWCAENVETQKEHNQNMSFSTMPYLRQTENRGNEAKVLTGSRCHEMLYSFVHRNRLKKRGNFFLLDLKDAESDG